MACLMPGYTWCRSGVYYLFAIPPGVETVEVYDDRATQVAATNVPEVFLASKV